MQNFVPSAKSRLPKNLSFFLKMLPLCRFHRMLNFRLSFETGIIATNSLKNLKLECLDFTEKLEEKLCKKGNRNFWLCMVCLKNLSLVRVTLYIYLKL